MILLDTCVLIFDALTPERLSAPARDAFAQGQVKGTLACADISLWEIAMLVSKGRLEPGTDSETFCQLVLDARGIGVLPITPAIALASTSSDLPSGDPADRLIAATAVVHGAELVTSDQRLLSSSAVQTIW